jgi:hypothetical protein
MDHRPLWARGQSWTVEETKALGWLAGAAVGVLFLVWMFFFR